MTAAHRIRATKPLEAWPGGVPQYASEREHRAALVLLWTGSHVAFDHPEHGRVIGLCVACEAIPRDGAEQIPDYRVEVRSLRSDRTAWTTLLQGRCEFYPTMEAAQSDPLLRKEGAR